MPDNNSSSGNILDTIIDANTNTSIKDILIQINSLLTSERFKNFLNSFEKPSTDKDSPGFSGNWIKNYQDCFCKRIKCSFIISIISFIFSILLIVTGGCCTLFYKGIEHFELGLFTIIFAGIICLFIGIKFLYLYRSSISQYNDLYTIRNYVEIAQSFINNLSVNEKDQAYKEMIKNIAENIKVVTITE
jgi:hypothetical protein